MDRFVCIHGHFYQPPRENPWLEAIEGQDSAYPYHDWNERVTDECYRPNAEARMLGGDGRLVSIVNNYARMSFNFGPTLLSWLEVETPEVYAAIIEADRVSAERFGGHGSAMAQAYNHMIMPLANDRDRQTQIVWGIRDFEHRFGRAPEGMWLPETAVDTATLDLLAAHGVAFTILAPGQARRVRRIGAGEWHEIGGKIDPSRPYRVTLPSGRALAVLFYDGSISHAVAFEHLLESGDRFADRLLTGFDGRRTHAQLVNVATDGETYGHHHRYGEMALAFALARIEAMRGVQLINYGAYLALFPPAHEVEIVEDSSWSCVHGVGRWREDCGCHTGGPPGWNQRWRAPLRDALDWLRDAVAKPFEEEAAKVLSDPWAARDAYIDVVLDRSPASIDRFLARWGRGPLTEPDQVRALSLLELQRNAMLMYTSCGWFFSDLAGIETKQVIAYAGRVIQLGESHLGARLEGPFLERLARAASNVPAEGTGRDIYVRDVKPRVVSLTEVGAHHAVSSLFAEEGEKGPLSVYAYEVAEDEERTLTSGRTKVRVGRAVITSRITHASKRVGYAAAHLGDHVVQAGVRPFDAGESIDAVARLVEGPFGRGEFGELLKAIETAFGPSTYSIRSLFPDDQRRIMGRILASKLERVRWEYRQIYERNEPLLRFLGTLRMPAPRELVLCAELCVNDDLRAAVESDPPDPTRLGRLVDAAARERLTIDEAGLRFAVRGALKRMSETVSADGERVEPLENAHAMLAALGALPFEVDLTELQIAGCDLRDRCRPGVLAAAGRGDAAARHWLDVFDRLAESLRIKVEERE